MCRINPARPSTQFAMATHFFDAGGATSMVTPASFSSRLNSGESLMIVAAAARSRSTASSGSTKVVGCRFR